MNNVVFKHKEVAANPNETYEFEYAKHCLMWNLMGINAEYMCDIYKHYCLPEVNKLLNNTIKRGIICKNGIKIFKNMIEKCFAYDLVDYFKAKCIEELGDDPDKINVHCYACKYVSKHIERFKLSICQLCPLDWKSKLICSNSLSEFEMLLYFLKRQNVDEVRKICYTIRDTKIKTESYKNDPIIYNPLPIRKHHKRKVMLKRADKNRRKVIHCISLLRKLYFRSYNEKFFDNLNIRIKNV